MLFDSYKQFISTVSELGALSMLYVFSNGANLQIHTPK